MEEIQRNVELTPNPKKDELKTLREQFSRPIADTLMDSARAQYGGDLKKSTQKQLERRIQETTDTVVTREYGDYTIRIISLPKSAKTESRRHSNPEPQWRRSRKLMKSMPQGVSGATVIWSTTSAGNSIAMRR